MSNSTSPLTFAASGEPFYNTGNGTIPLRTCTPDLCSLAYAQIQYQPSMAGNLIYLLIFGALLITQLGLGIAYKTWSFMWPMTVGLLGEVVGYVGRIQLHSNPFRFGNFLT
jgi:uncharacterized integral membrane protein